MKRFARDNQIGMALVITVVLFVINIIINPASLNTNTFANIINFTLLLLFASAGQTLVITTGGIDLSNGAVMSFAAIIAVNIMRGEPGHMPAVLALVIPMSLLTGLVNGIGVVKLKLPAMVITMCVSNVVGRLQYVYTAGLPAGMASVPFTEFVQKRFLGVIPGMTIFGVAFIAVTVYLLNRSRYGQQLLLTGNNKNAAYLTGIKSDLVEIMTYVLASLLAGIGGVIGAGYVKYVICQSFDSYTMMSIVAVVVGGTLLVGGKASFVGTAVGAMLIVVLNNCLAMLKFSDSMTNVIMGVVLLLLLAVYNREKPIRQ